MPTQAAEPMPNRRLFYGLACASLLMFSVDSSIVAVALRSIVLDLDTTLALAGWTLTGYALAQVVAMPVVGKLGERFGQLRVFVVCVAVFTLGSLLCGLAPNVYVLIACRILQALGGGGIMPSAVALIVRAFPESRNRMLGLFTSIFPLGGIIGPNLGGLLLEHLPWRALFLVNVPVGLVVVPLLARLIARYDGGARAPDARVPDAPAPDAPARRLDLAGAALFAGLMSGLLLALTFVGQDPGVVRTPTFWLLLVASAGCLVLFVRQERRVVEPIIDLSLVSKHPFLVVNLHNLLFGACVWGTFAFVPYFASVQYAMSPLESGAVLTPRSIASILLGTATSFLLVRLGYRAPIVAGLGVIAVSNIVLGQGWIDPALGPVALPPFVWLGILLGAAGVGTGLVMPAANNAALDLLPDRAGVISGLRGMCRSIGGIVGTATIVVILELSPDKAAGLRTAFTAYGVLLLAAIPLTFLIPDLARASRREGGRPSGEARPGSAAEDAPAKAPA